MKIKSIKIFVLFDFFLITADQVKNSTRVFINLPSTLCKNASQQLNNDQTSFNSSSWKSFKRVNTQDSQLHLYGIVFEII